MRPDTNMTWAGHVRGKADMGQDCSPGWVTVAHGGILLARCTLSDIGQ
jgi:hypothetical protein